MYPPGNNPADSGVSRKEFEAAIIFLPSLDIAIEFQTA